jgi:predicted ATPase
MISSVRIQRIKRFQDETIPFKLLTVLCGTNGGGKTTVIHSILLARLAAQQNEIDLGNVFGQRLGEASDLLHVGADQNEGLEVSLKHENIESHFRFEAILKRTQQLRSRSLSQTPSASPMSPFVYLCADRLGPRDSQETVALTEDNMVGVRGEHVAQFMDQNPARSVSEKLRHPNAVGALNSFKPQVEAWLSAIVRPTEIDSVWHPNSGVASLRFRQPGFLGEWVRPINAGFGLSTAIPIVVAGLSISSQGGFLIVENPEAHLHPKGQSQVGQFLANVAACGTQVLLETHSDHVLNGVRIAVAKNKTLHSDQVVVNSFDSSETESGVEQPKMTSLTISENGELDSWPPTFFDQFEKDLGMLAEARRKR